MEGNRTRKTRGAGLNRAKAKLLSTYYGNPAKDLRLICITGSTGKIEVANFVREILMAAGQSVAILATDEPIKASILHRFLNDSWKAKATYAVITTPASSLANEVFYGLPIHTAALTDFVPAGLSDDDLYTFLDSEKTLFQMSPDVVILNRDDVNYPEFASFRGKETTLTYGTSSDSDLTIERSKLYKKGTEVSLSLNHRTYTAASFLAGAPIVSYMACAAAIATALGINNDAIIDGLANYQKEA